MTKERNHAPQTLAGMVRILDDVNATPTQVRAARDWGLVPAGLCRIWLVGFLAGRRAGPPAPANFTPQGEAGPARMRSLDRT